MSHSHATHEILNPKLFVARAYTIYPELASPEFTAALFPYDAAANAKVTLPETPFDFLIELQKTIDEQNYDVVAFESRLFDESEVCLMSKSLYQGIRSGTLVNSDYADFIHTADAAHLTKLDALLG